MIPMEPKKTEKGGKAGKSSKTAHVLNLLSGTPAGPELVSAPQPPAPPPPAAPAAQPALPILEIARTNNQQLSEMIHTALEDALESELQAEQSVQDPAAPDASAPDSPPSAQQKADRVSESADAPSLSESAPLDVSPTPEFPPAEGPAQESAPHGDPPAEESLPAAMPAESAAPEAAGIHPLPDGSLFLNVMEILAEEDFVRYSAPAGLCPCPRCQADARALALTRLPSKYVVLPAAARDPMLALYRNQFHTDVFTQVLMACQAVQEHPRHGTAP